MGRKQKPRNPADETAKQATEPPGNPQEPLAGLELGVNNVSSSESPLLMNESYSATVKTDPAKAIEITDQDANKSPIWSRSVQRFATEEPKLFDLMKDIIERFGNESVENWKIWLNNRLEKRQENSTKWLRRCKAYLPSFKVMKTLVTSISNLDPHKIAPIFTTAFFVAVELCFESLDPSARDKAMSMMMKVKILIDKWADAEVDLEGLKTQFLKSDENLNKIDRIEENLGVLYMECLSLISSIYKAGKTRWGRARSTLISEPAEWDQTYEKLNDKNTACGELKNQVELAVKRNVTNTAILDHIRIRSEDPEPGHQSVKERTGISDPESIAGNWFVESDELNSWLGEIRHGETEKRLLWLKGSMGTGKTTLICRVISHYTSEPIPDIRFVPYYCYASGTSKESKAPKHETIVRALCRRLAWNAGASIAKPARDFYGITTRDPDASSSVTSTWEPLLKDLIAFSKSTIIFVIDALDECEDMKEYNRFLRFLGGLPSTPKGPYCLISSRPHVRVRDYFNASIQVDATNQEAKDDMKKFITDQIDSKNNRTWATSIFFKSEEYRKRLEKALLKNAGGMFRWVEIWLSIFFPANGKPIRQARYAQNLLVELEQPETLDRLVKAQGSESNDYEDHWKNQLDEAYKKLWAINGDEQYEALQISAFQVVMGAFRSLTPQQLLEAVCLANDDTTLTLDELEDLYCNFLKVNNEGCLNFEHLSAKIFVSEMKKEGSDESKFSEATCHRALANIAITAIEQPNHRIWGGSGINLIDLDTCRESILTTARQPYSYFTLDPGTRRYNKAKAIEAPQSSQYLFAYWISHCGLCRGDKKLARRLLDNFSKSKPDESGLEHWILQSIWLDFDSDNPKDRKLRISSDQRFLPHDALVLSTCTGETVIRISPLLFMIGLGFSPFIQDAGTTPILLKGFHDDHITLANVFGRVSLHFACSMGDNNMVTNLLKMQRTKEGSCTLLLNAKDRRGRIPLHYAHSEDVVRTILEYERTDGSALPTVEGRLISELLDKRDEFGTTPVCNLFKTCSEEYLELVSKSYSFASVQLNEALTTAVKQGRERVAGFILKNGGNINHLDKFNSTPLATAASTGNLGMMKFLFDRGALLDCGPGKGTMVLVKAVRSHKIKAVRYILDKRDRLGINELDMGEALREASENGDIKIARFLLDRGADINAQDRYYGGALGAAVCYRRFEMLQLLLDRGADINAKGGCYGTPLGAAIYALWPEQKGETIKFLLSRGANIDLLNEEDKAEARRYIDVD
ncbi:hypothetical protein F4678DRAFT_312854 [Xylaria arbuscula]|nr:hypothetical protein F4678DRAFT_312854 [Xylaria arbuscula]